MSEPILEKFTFVHAIKADAIVELNGARRAILPVFKMGITALADKRGSFKMDEQDFSLLKINLSTKGTVTPILYEHGKGNRGGIAGGKLISLQEKGGEIYAHATLTKKAYEECKDEEWLSCSGGFLARRDAEDNIRPVEMLEVSFTNMPAFPGLSDIQKFAVLKELPMTEIKAIETQVEVTPTPEPVAEVKLEATVVDALVEKASADILTSEKPVVVNVTALELAKLYTQVTVDVACPCPNCPCAGCSCCTADAADEPAGNMAREAEKTEDIVHLTAEQTESVIELAATARFEDKVKKEKIIVLMALGETDGKIIPANKKAMETLCTSDPNAFEVVLATMKPILPTKKTVTDAVIHVDLGLLDTSVEHEAAILTKTFQLKAKHPELNITELSNIVKSTMV